MKQYKIQNRSQKNSHSCVPLTEYANALALTFVPRTSKYKPQKSRLCLIACVLIVFHNLARLKFCLPH